jgi:hypothetical protein
LIPDVGVGVGVGEGEGEGEGVGEGEDVGEGEGEGVGGRLFLLQRKVSPIFKHQNSPTVFTITRFRESQVKLLNSSGDLVVLGDGVGDGVGDDVGVGDGFRVGLGFGVGAIVDFGVDLAKTSTKCEASSSLS